MYTKGQFVDDAYEQLTLAGYVFDMTPEELQAALRSLDAMMATWNGQGIRLGYAASSNPKNVDASTSSGVPDAANEAIVMNLAMRRAAAFGKTPMRTTAIAADQGYKMLLARAVQQATVPMQYPGTMPSGAGQKAGRYRTFLNQPTDPLTAGADDPLTFD